MRSGDIVRIKTEEEIKRIPGAEKERTGYRIPFRQDGIYINRDMLASGGYHARILLVENGRAFLAPLGPLDDMELHTERWVFIESVLEPAYAVGQRVRVKPFEQLVREYRSDSEGIHFPDGEVFLQKDRRLVKGMQRLGLTFLTEIFICWMIGRRT